MRPLEDFNPVATCSHCGMTGKINTWFNILGENFIQCRYCGESTKIEEEEKEDDSIQ